MKEFFESIKIRKVLFVWIVSTVVVMVISETEHFKNKTSLDEYFWLTIANSIVFLWFAYKMWRSNISIGATIVDYKDKFDFKDCFKILSINIVIVIGLVATIFSVSYIINPEFLTKLLMESEPNVSIISLVFNFTGTVVLAPFIEEFIFRGVLLNRLAMRYSLSKAIILSSVLFGIVHVDFAAVGAIFFGIMMCLVYIKTDNILITISIHAINNFIMWLCNFIPAGGAQVSLTKLEVISLFSMSVILLPASIFFAFKYIRKNWPNSCNVENIISDK